MCKLEFKDMLVLVNLCILSTDIFVKSSVCEMIPSSTENAIQARSDTWKQGIAESGNCGKLTDWQVT